MSDSGMAEKSSLPSFTPGPWSVGSSEPAGAWITASFDGGDVGPITGSVARVFSHLYMSPEEAQANLALILSAPELFAALQEALADEEAYERGERASGAWKNKARAAIRKVTQGESQWDNF